MALVTFLTSSLSSQKAAPPKRLAHRPGASQDQCWLHHIRPSGRHYAHRRQQVGGRGVPWRRANHSASSSSTFREGSRDGGQAHLLCTLPLISMFGVFKGPSVTLSGWGSILSVLSLAVCSMESLTLF